MFGMQTNGGVTRIVDRRNGRVVKYDNLHDALLYIGIMKDIYYEKQQRGAMEPYQVRTLCPGTYPIKIKN